MSGRSLLQVYKEALQRMMQEEFDYIELQKVFAFPMLCTEQYILLNRRVLTLEDTYT